MTDKRQIVKNQVLEALQNNAETRKDDMKLTAEIIKNSDSVKLNSEDRRTLIRICRTWREMGLPNINTVVRCRRAEQLKDSSLIDEETAAYRREEEARFHNEYSRK